jgi:hypothetical protein
MAATYVTESQLRTALGIGNLYTSAVVEDVCQAAENIVKGKLWFNTAELVATELQSNVATVYTSSIHPFAVGQSITITRAGATFNGTYTITATNSFSFSFAKTASDQIYNQIKPYGVITGSYFGVDYATTSEINQASLMIAVDIWQARQASNAGGISPDFQPSPYRMGNTLMARVRGLLADHLAPGGQVG